MFFILSTGGGPPPCFSYFIDQLQGAHLFVELHGHHLQFTDYIKVTRVGTKHQLPPYPSLVIRISKTLHRCALAGRPIGVCRTLLWTQLNSDVSTDASSKVLQKLWSVSLGSDPDSLDQICMTESPAFPRTLPQRGIGRQCAHLFHVRAYRLRI